MTIPSEIALDPMDGMRFIHKAIRRELSALEARAESLGANDTPPSDIEHMEQRADFLARAVKFHSEGEDEVLYPALDERAANVSAPYTLDHQAEEEIFTAIAALFAEYRRVPDTDARKAVLRQLWRRFVAMNATLTLHIRKEEELLVPLAERCFTPAELGAMAGKISRHIPPQYMEDILKWMLDALDAHEQEVLTRMMLAALPTEVLPTFKRWVKETLTPVAWQDLAARVPALLSA